MRLKNLVVEDVKLLPEGRGFLLCEFGADTPEAVDAMAAALTAATSNFECVPTVAVYTAAEAARVWRVRESALGASVFVPGEESGWEGWEDSAVPPASLGAYLRELFALIEHYGYRSPMYGHFGQGCVHLRITFKLKTAEGVAAYRRFIEEAADIVLKYGGSFSGEHGDGQARAALLPKMFGPELMTAFARFKALWDPLNRMNPGKLIDPVAVYDPTENLRIGAGYVSAERKTWFQYPADQGSFSDATSRCVGVGACRKQDNGTMCPSYMVTREETHSTRGRAHLLWEMMQGDILKQGWRNEQVKMRWTFVFPARHARQSVPSMWIWRPGSRSSSLITLKVVATPCSTMPSASWISGPGSHPSLHRLQTLPCVCPWSPAWSSLPLASRLSERFRHLPHAALQSPPSPPSPSRRRVLRFCYGLTPGITTFTRRLCTPPLQYSQPQEKVIEESSQTRKRTTPPDSSRFLTPSQCCE